MGVLGTHPNQPMTVTAEDLGVQTPQTGRTATMCQRVPQSAANASFAWIILPSMRLCHVDTAACAELAIRISKPAQCAESGSGTPCASSTLWLIEQAVHAARRCNEQSDRSI